MLLLSLFSCCIRNEWQATASKVHTSSLIQTYLSHSLYMQTCYICLQREKRLSNSSSRRSNYNIKNNKTKITTIKTISIRLIVVLIRLRVLSIKHKSLFFALVVFLVFVCILLNILMEQQQQQSDVVLRRSKVILFPL